MKMLLVREIMQKEQGLGPYINKRRLALRLSRASLADLLTANGYECTESAINHWENGRAFPPIDEPTFARALAQALNVPPSEILKASGLLSIAPETAKIVLARLSPQALRMLEEASPKQVKKLDALIRTFLAEDE